jgi:hypothetical protein
MINSTNTNKPQYLKNTTPMTGRWIIHMQYGPSSYEGGESVFVND